MIDERLEEQASLHVLGGLSAEETSDFETELRQNEELRKFVADLGGVASALAGTVPLVAPPPALREKVLARIGQAETQSEKIVQFPTQPRSNPFLTWLPWTLAAGFAMICWLQNLNQNSLRTQISTLTQTAAALQSATNNLQHAIAELQQSANPANLRVAVLNSLVPDQPKAVAVSLWSEKTQTGEFIVQDMKPLPANKDYQLWIIDPAQAAPVDAGVFQVDDQGKGRIQFKTKQPVKTAGKFAVTLEAKGGSSSGPKGTMVLIGG